jgi:hypothetical protein
MSDAYIQTIKDAFVLVLAGQFNEGKFTPSNVSTAIRLTIDEVQHVFDQFEAIGNVDLDEVTIQIGQIGYVLQREQARVILSVVSQVLFAVEVAQMPEELIAPEEFWDEEYLLSL